jgi:hypothetical protein
MTGYILLFLAYLYFRNERYKFEIYNNNRDDNYEKYNFSESDIKKSILFLLDLKEEKDKK